MNSLERKQEILRLLRDKDKVEVEELTELFGVSKVTVRTDLDALEAKGLLIRTHGGAMAPEQQSWIRRFTNTITEHTDEKGRIAKAAASLIKDGDALIIDNGSTTVHLSKYLSGKHLTVATGSLLVINEIMNDDSIELMILGGMLRHYSMGVIGPMTRLCLDQFHADWLFLGASAFSMEKGVFCTNIVEAETKQLMIKSSSQVCFLADSSKLDARLFGKICDWNSIDYFITDAISDKNKAYLESLGVKVILA